MAYADQAGDSAARPVSWAGACSQEGPPSWSLVAPPCHTLQYSPQTRRDRDARLLPRPRFLSLAELSPELDICSYHKATQSGK